LLLLSLSLDSLFGTVFIPGQIGYPEEMGTNFATDGAVVLISVGVGMVVVGTSVVEVESDIRKKLRPNGP